MILTYEVLLTPTIGTKNLIITDVRVSVVDSDANDYINTTSFYGRLAGGSWDAAQWTVDHDGVHGTGAGTFTYGVADVTIGGTFKGAFMIISCSNANARVLKIGNLEVEYYYG